MAKRKRKYEGPEVWRRRIATWEESGLSVTEFAEREGLCKSSFLRWRKRLGGKKWVQRGPSRAAVSSLARTKPTDVDRGTMALLNAQKAQPLSFVELAPTVGATSVEHKHGVPFEVSLRSGRRLQVPASFEPETLRQLVAILEVQ